ncbi:twin-arginine translocation signal domain-containing protein [bacterium]|nr:twin-arginine translocation signal domain-containing protein [bacterium]
MKKNSTNRRSFLKQSTLAAGTTALAPALISAQPNEKVRCGFIGVGNRGSQLLHGFMKQPDVKVGAICDVYQPYLDRVRDHVDPFLRESLGGRVPRMGETLDRDVKKYTDFRQLLEQKDLDAVVIATPDHWHAIQMIHACEAGFDVYVEKPLSITIHEGRKMVEAAERTNRIVQVGLHRRSANLYRKAHELLQVGSIGRVTVSRAYRISNMAIRGIGEYTPEKPVEGLDWDLWLGPRAERGYQDNITPYKFRWWQLYSSQIANWGVHYFDTIRWCLDELAPVSISAHGGRFAVDDDRTVPDTAEVIFELPQSLLVFGQYEASGGDAILHDAEIEFRGTLGNMFTGAEGGGFIIEPTRWGQFQEGGKKIEKQNSGDMDGDLTEQHIRNFVDCVKSRKQPNCDIETGHRSTTFAHLANISLATQSRLDWDPKNEVITNNKEANALLHYEYRKPWSL